MNESKSGASPSTKKSGNYKIPLILSAIGLLLMISPFFYSAYVDATVDRDGPDNVPVGWTLVWASCRFTLADVIILIIALFMAFVEKISNIPNSDN